MAIKVFYRQQSHHRQKTRLEILEHNAFDELRDLLHERLSQKGVEELVWILRGLQNPEFFAPVSKLIKWQRACLKRANDYKSKK